MHENFRTHLHCTKIYHTKNIYLNIFDYDNYPNYGISIHAVESILLHKHSIIHMWTACTCYVYNYVICMFHNSIHESLANEVREFLGLPDFERITTITASKSNTSKKDE